MSSKKTITNHAPRENTRKRVTPTTNHSPNRKSPRTKANDPSSLSRANGPSSPSNIDASPASTPVGRKTTVVRGHGATQVTACEWTTLPTPAFPIARPWITEEPCVTYCANSWVFCSLSVPSDVLVDIVIALFHDLALFDSFDISLATFRNFVEAVRARYYNNPYHNFNHAVDVTQGCFLLIKQSSARKYLRPLDVLTLMCSALCHDLEHPGTNNAFQRNTKSELSAKYPEGSVLEQHHYATFVSLVNSPGNEIFAALSDTQVSEIMALSKRIILSTDTANHAAFFKNTRARLDTGTPLSPESEEDRLLVMLVLMDASDISNVSRPHGTSRLWCKAVQTEFLEQYTRETELGLPITVPPATVAPRGLSSGFIDFLGRPLFNILVAIFPELSHLLLHLDFNRNVDAADFATASS